MLIVLLAVFPLRFRQVGVRPKNRQFFHNNGKFKNESACTQQKHWFADKIGLMVTGIKKHLETNYAAWWNGTMSMI